MPRIYRVTIEETAPKLTLSSNAANSNLLPFDGSPKAERSPSEAFSVHQASPVTDPHQFWALAPGVIVYPETMIGEDVYDSPYYSWVYQVELLALRGEFDSFWGMNAQEIYPHPRTGYRFDLTCSYPLFRLEGECATDLFCLEGQEVTEDELPATCRNYGLKGLCFEEVWHG